MHPVELCALEVFRVKGHRAIRRDALAVMSWSVIISGSSQLLLECTALLSRSPPASAQQSPRLWCWGHTRAKTSVSQQSMMCFYRWDSFQRITSAVEEIALLSPGIEPKWARSVCPYSTERTKNKRLFLKYLHSINSAFQCQREFKMYIFISFNKCVWLFTVVININI